MVKAKTHAEKTSADAIAIAFDYQYYFFLWKLLSLKLGESVGFEVKDDVHTELSDSEQVYYQIKHTTKRKSDCSPVNLTPSDPDLWKTLSNWAKVICDKDDNRAAPRDQLIFLKKATFVLASNKSSAGSNSILKSIVDLQTSTKPIDEVKTVLHELCSGSKNETLQGHIQDVLALSDRVLTEFLERVHFELDEIDIIRRCKDEIKADKVPEKKIDSVFSSIDSAVRADNFINIENGAHIPHIECC